MTYHFHVGFDDDAIELVKKHHYSRRWPSNVQCVGTWHESGGLFGDRGAAVAACVFSIPPTRWSVDLLELCRLVRSPICTQSLTGLIAATCDFMRRKKMADLLVSFADATQGHHGGIYQAASWHYDGQRNPAMDGVVINGVFRPGRSCNSTWGTRSPEKLRQILQGQSVEPHYDAGKHLYWRPLNNAGKKKAVFLGLKQLPYAKPNQLIIASGSD